MTTLLLSVAMAAVLHGSAADSARWIVSNHGREAGDLVVTHRGDSVIARWVFTDRNRGTRLETRYRVGPDGRVVSGESRPVLADGSAGEPTEAFSSTRDSVRQGVPSGPGGVRASARGATDWLALRGDTPWAQAELAQALLSAKRRPARIAGGPTLRAELIADTVLRRGAARQRARLVMIYRGTTPNPYGVWIDERGGLLATEIAWFITVRPDVVPLMPALRAIELRWRDARAEAAAKTVGKDVGTLVLRNGNVFDSERGVLVPQQSVVIRDGRIVEVGAASSVTVPAGATVVDVTGKTVMPGMWEMHAHAQVATQYVFGMTQLAQGITTARDLAADVDVAVSLRDRVRAGKLAAPRYILAGFMEGPLAWAGPTATVVSTEAEARRWVARYDSLGYKQIKLYNVLHPDLVPVIAAEAKKRGMRLSGHIPRGLSIEAAVGLGYDEIQHAAFFFSNFYQDSLYLPQMRAYSQVATAVAPTIDVNGAPMTRLIEYLKAHNTVVDGTFNLWIGGGGASVGAGGSRDQLRADSAYMTLLRRLYAAGVPLTAGTDNAASTTYRRELTMMELAGIPRAKILQVATIESARIMREERDYGSVAVGKVSDVLIVNGNPLERMADLSKLETVIRGRRMYTVSELEKAAGSAGGASGLGAWGIAEPGDPDF
ncbi:MAG: amidohydrolase family protein [Gemmatimonadaceae bacterium]|nr:amidohydrolase family protein [Gemmatimonadaceae bacterium]